MISICWLHSRDDDLVNALRCLRAQALEWSLAPVLTVNDKVYPGMTPDAAAELIHELRGAE